MRAAAKHLWRADLALVGNTLIWGATFVVVKEALRGVTPFLFLALRFSVATVALLVLLRGAWARPRHGLRSLAAGALAGVFLFAGYAFQTLGLRLTTPSKSAFLTGLSTVMVPLLGSLVYRSRPRAVELAGVVLATAGMGLMTLERASAAGMNPGDLLTIACALAYAGHILVLGHFSGRDSFEFLSFTQVAVSALLALCLCGLVETPRIAWRPSVWGAVLVTGLLATALAFTVQAWAQQYTSSTRTALIFTLEPVFAWITSYVLTGETLSGRATAGAGLILTGILVVELKPFRVSQHLWE